LCYGLLYLLFQKIKNKSFKILVIVTFNFLERKETYVKGVIRSLYGIAVSQMTKEMFRLS
jgi:hypothetical protein